ncbi:uncharacterized protein TA05200 [Theileria annulata]|uniref:Uncharacterized protein n=1 Tax=Theileria annulata TaxID=5874 RepID=Q4UBM8_THEAN|nr:uncharacterized protein TA05200 [Theileria annulata]CAI75773.1 hypothetical protein TA05200 [Theileria annulata]|eukprot:XP_955249.1 hypothetical protein TA05200 [Theileria annulata]
MDGNNKSVCFLFDGDNSECVKYALNLIKRVLDCCCYKGDKKLLLIYNRYCFTDDVDILERLFTPSTESSKLINLHQDYKNSSDYDKLIDDFLKQCIESQPSETLSYTDTFPINNTSSSFNTYSNTLNNYSSPTEHTSENTPNDSVTDIKVYAENNSEHDVRLITYSYDSMDDYMDNVDKLLNSLENVEHIFVTGLSNLLDDEMFEEEEEEEYHEVDHPFSFIGFSEDEVKVYDEDLISLYCLSLELVLNHLKQDENQLISNSDCGCDLIPKFFLFDRLPSDSDSATKFAKFISDRFNRTYFIH